MARNFIDTENSKGRLRPQQAAIPRGQLILLLGLAAWMAVALVGSGIWQFLVAALS
jgi:hypothetical protein